MLFGILVGLAIALIFSDKFVSWKKQLLTWIKGKAESL